MPDLTLRRRLSEPVTPLNIALNGVVPPAPVASISADVYWRWEDEPDMKPQLLGSQAKGFALTVPFEPQDREVRLFFVSWTADGRRSVHNLNDAPQRLFRPFSPPYLSDVAFADDEVTGTIRNNGGTGTIHILRKIDSGDFAEIDAVTPAVTGFTDTPAVDGTYSYKLIQDGIGGESNTETVDVNVGEPGTGSPPSGLSASYNGTDTITLAWTNNGGTGSNVLEVKTGTGGIWVVAETLASSSTGTTYTAEPGPVNIIYRFRVRNESVAGYSNEVSIVVPKETF
jgi:hypothetical protein